MISLLRVTTNGVTLVLFLVDNVSLYPAPVRLPLPRVFSFPVVPTLVTCLSLYSSIRVDTYPC